MRYRLRTLLILLAIGPPMLAGAWWWIETPRNFVAGICLWLFPPTAFTFSAVAWIVQCDLPSYPHLKRVPFALLGTASMLVVAWLLVYAWLWFDYWRTAVYSASHG